MLTMEAKRQKESAAFSRTQFDLLMKCSAKHDMTEWNAWRKQNPNQPVLLQNANIEGAYLRGADLHKADFRGANLRGVDLSGAKRFDFKRRWADLSGADFTAADLCGTDFRGANLSGANFERAYLFYTNFSWTNLSGANFSGADLWAFLFRANLASVDLSRANRRFSAFTRIGCQYTKKGKSPQGAVMDIRKAVPEYAPDKAKRPWLSSPDLEINLIAIQRDVPDFETLPGLRRAVG